MSTSFPIVSVDEKSRESAFVNLPSGWCISMDPDGCHYDAQKQMT